MAEVQPLYGLAAALRFKPALQTRIFDLPDWVTAYEGEADHRDLLFMHR